VVCLNAAPAFVACDKARTLQEGYELAGKVIDRGGAMEKLERLIEFTNKA
jgi:anthranilate phosphoribosyltransferase